MISELIRPHLKSLTPYQSARDIYNSSEGIFLDANESAFGSCLPGQEFSFNRYPDPAQRAMRQALAKYLQIEDSTIFFGVGSDEIINLVITLFAEPSLDSILVVEPTYGMYETSARIQNVGVKKCLLNNDFTLNAENVLASVEVNTKIIFLCSPNNPTGNILEREQIQMILTNYRGIVVVDEAYIDFGSPSNSVIDLVKSNSRLIVLRTMSKAWGLAAIRLGYAIANEETISYLFRIKAPYSINVSTEKLFLHAMANIELMKSNIVKMCIEREYLYKELQKILPEAILYPSETNYILIRYEGASQLQKELMNRKIVIRDRGTQPLLMDCVRVTVGTRQENDALLKGIQELLLQRRLNETGDN
ncbi:MAG: histidinol-phosphate transaminase [Ignavibacteria bacterium]|nr:histidinol-phosphate transaminase [Ignavibacteria bacterium]